MLLNDCNLQALVEKWRESLPELHHVDLLKFARFIAQAQHHATYREELNIRIDECVKSCSSMTDAYPDINILIDSFFVKRIEDYRAEIRAKEIQP